LLALSSDEKLKALAKRDIEGATSSNEQATLGDGWWTLAEKQEGMAKKQIQGRAAHWYKQALPGLSGLVKDKVEKRLTSVGPITRDDGFSSGVVEILPRIDLERDRVVGGWEKRLTE